VRVEQEIPDGTLETAPRPSIETANPGVSAVNVAVTFWLALTVTVQGPMPEQPPPLQPVNVEPVAGVAVSVTEVPDANGAEHVSGQAIPAGSLETVPTPDPLGATSNVCGISVNVAVTV
jgi:hypothetical protein